MTLRLNFPIGNSDFAKIRNQGSEYVDKTALVAEILHDDTEVFLFPRPRRFGKTLNLSMLRYFFDVQLKASQLFEGLAIQSTLAFTHQGQYPVIFLTLKDVKEPSFEATFEKISAVVAEAYAVHEYLLESTVLNEPSKALFKKLLAAEADQPELENSLRTLTHWLFQYHQKPVVILLDEYDTPIQAAYLGSFYEKLIGMMRNFMSAAFKDNPCLFKGVITGILRVSKEGMFSGLNNLKVYSVLSNRYAQHFGFTQKEVDALLDKVHRKDLQAQVREWYNGFQFGTCEIYNPWSVINFFAENYQYQPYWVGTSDNALVKQILARGSSTLKSQFEALVRGESIEQAIDEYITFPSIFKNEDVAWSLLLFSGYLKVTSTRPVAAHYSCQLQIPNLEIRMLFEEFLMKFFDEDNYTKNQYKALLTSLTEGDVELFQELLEDYLLACFSYFDTQGREPERFYHGFVLGLLVSLKDTHQVRSNRESGYGRYDVMIVPKDNNKLATIIEFKVVRTPQKLEPGVAQAFQQIEDKGYARTLKSEGYSHLQIMAIVFCGKDMRLEVQSF